MTPQDRISDQMKLLRQRFRVRCAERGAALSQACDEGDLEALRGLAHDITGSAGLFGFPALSQEAQRLSEACRLGSDEATFRLARELSASLLAVAAEGD
ncbi:Hpt domain-containing protein [Sphingomonas sp. GCM10030256]|uniref:Hpt domain-containing protein n=1 Tax=Sphingomonas sp. GCM10030256 TaxID=3273427 RepID=UPI003610EB25